ncbi:hypothetical protein [Neisseria chenwenguii]|nr:hypothetical protein [Neisseria chenwenguii]
MPSDTAFIRHSSSAGSYACKRPSENPTAFSDGLSSLVSTVQTPHQDDHR